MSAPLKPWDSNTLQNNGNMLQANNIIGAASSRGPSLPPRPQSLPTNYNSPYSSSGYGSNYGSGYSSYGGYTSNYPYRSSLYNSYNSYGGNYGTYGGGYGGMGGPAMYGGAGMSSGRDDAETRFIQFAEESSRNTFANVESVVRAFNSVASMMDNTLFAMTSSFRAILGVAENVHRLRSTFAQIFHVVNVFRLVRWFYRTFLRLAGVTIPQHLSSTAWSEATASVAVEAGAASGSGPTPWSTLAFIAVLVSIPYIITKMLPKYEDKQNPERWRSSGIRAKVAFDFAASSPNELTIHTNDEILLAPKHIQEEMRLTNSGWAYATTTNNNQCGVVPLNYIVIVKRTTAPTATEHPLPVPVPPPSIYPKPQKRVTFGENQVFDDESHTSTSDQSREQVLNKIKRFDANREAALKEHATSTAVENIPVNVACADETEE